MGAEKGHKAWSDNSITSELTSTPGAFQLQSNIFLSQMMWLTRLHMEFGGVGTNEEQRSRNLCWEFLRLNNEEDDSVAESLRHGNIEKVYINGNGKK